MRMTGKTAVITGAGSGIGRGIALVLARDGAEVAVVDKQRERATSVAKEVESLGREAIALSTDVSQSDEVNDMVKVVLHRFDKIDVLVNNVAIRGQVAPVLDLDESNWDMVMSVNAKSAFLCSKAVAPHMIRQRAGKIINISATAGKRNNALSAHYGASKFALIGFTQALALELAPYGINVNAVCPGPTDTPMWWAFVRSESHREGISPESWSERFCRERIPLGRMNTPEDIGHLVSFLASDEAGAITGIAFTISGGMELL
jgi:NAD(P)-dependent dehydrogenase (short-subunit alcohol dehydrogenase family)